MEVLEQKLGNKCYRNVLLQVVVTIIYYLSSSGQRLISLIS